MRMNALRAELNEMISCVPVPRRAVIRRSLEDEWLYASDLPVLCSDTDFEEIRQYIQKELEGITLQEESNGRTSSTADAG